VLVLSFPTVDAALLGIYDVQKINRLSGSNRVTLRKVEWPQGR
jgi:hypothetical protein